MKTLKFDVHGMTCGSCTGSVQRALGEIEAAISNFGYSAKSPAAQPSPMT